MYAPTLALTNTFIPETSTSTLVKQILSLPLANTDSNSTVLVEEEKTISSGQDEAIDLMGITITDQPIVITEDVFHFTRYQH